MYGFSYVFSQRWREIQTMGAVGSLWNRDIQARLKHLTHQVASRKQRSKPTRPQFQRRRPGSIATAIAAVLADQEQGMRVRDVVQAVTAALGEPVSASSIKACLWTESQSSTGKFERIGRGRYRLRAETT